MQREIMWSSLDGPGLEHLQIIKDENGGGVGSLVIGVADGKAFRIKYQIYLAADWRVTEVIIQTFENSGLTLVSGTEGQWTTMNGSPVEALEGCTEIDISITPFTNTLPIQRLNLSIGESAEIKVVYIAIPKFDVRPVTQRYTRVSELVYHFELLDSGFTADLTVDNDNFIVDYPALFKQVWNKPLG
jgi:uncharacterized protein